MQLTPEIAAQLAAAVVSLIATIEKLVELIKMIVAPTN